MIWDLANSSIIAVLFVVCILLWFKSRKAERARLEVLTKLKALELELEQAKQESLSTSVHQQQAVVGLKKQQQEVLQHLEKTVQSISTIANQTAHFATELEQTKDLVHILKSESKEQKLYGRAKKMIEMGADSEELISECEIPRAEAELLMSLYKR